MCCQGRHRSIQWMFFLKLTNRRTQVSEKMEIILAKAGTHRCWGRWVSRVCGSTSLCPFPHLDALQPWGNLPTPPLPRARLLWEPTQGSEAAQSHIQRGPWVVLHSVPWALGSDSVPLFLNVPGVLTAASIPGEAENPNSSPGSATLSFTWSWTRDLTFSVPWLGQLNRSHNNYPPISGGRQICKDKRRSWP